ncbi:hypothetical protein BC939DRAFT_491544 [Gamsiella multidivaricata]|uniref:uncharacterized protein n=1 Tax=Gamsiella multidivaricata TaxID=101098 RepID=UPI00221F02AB|nr:uncharacterized protein BC939DRAFT_491544 [Gamsiella multidivaricata]KAG0358176.1 hypothetical protein BGZ54_010549 [Gamsiella multidivaricata]KAI7827177.1 hypothetical protein BC939DRAFT_491544 [Gamsiella multidivaricata]
MSRAATAISAPPSAPSAISTRGNRTGASSNAQRSELTCPGCHGTNILEDPEVGALVCCDCGHVLQENILSNALDAAGVDNTSYYGTTLVSRTGRSLLTDTRHGAFAYISVANAATRIRLYRRKRFEQVRTLLATVARGSGLKSADSSRAYYLWKNIMSISNPRFWNPAARAALACLYLAAKEAKRGITLIDIAVRAEMSPYKIGAACKQVKSTLIELKILDLDSSQLLNAEEDPWTMLERIMTIGSADSNERGEMERLAQDIQDAFGFNLEDETRASSLRSLLSSAQKCMAIAMDASLPSGRNPQGMVAACLIVAVEVRLMLTKVPEELFEFVALVFRSAKSTVAIRYKELRKCMLVWAQQLPFHNNARDIKDKKLVYYMEDVIVYFGHLKEHNKRLWTLLDKAGCAISDEEDFDRWEQDPELEQVATQDEFLSVMRDGDTDEEEPESFEGEQDIKDHDSSHSNNGFGEPSNDKSDPRLYPPAYLANRERERRQAELIQVAKGEAEYSPAPFQKAKTQEPQDLARINRIKRLLELGARTEQELIEASDNALEYWLRSDEAKASDPGVTRTQEEMASVELTGEDLDEQEFEKYKRTPSERQALLRIMEPTYLEAEQKAKYWAQRRHAPKKPPRSRDKRERPHLSVASQGGQQAKKMRSSKINWDAITDMGDSGAEEVAVKQGMEEMPEEGHWPPDLGDDAEFGENLVDIDNNDDNYQDFEDDYDDDYD